MFYDSLLSLYIVVIRDRSFVGSEHYYIQPGPVSISLGWMYLWFCVCIHSCLCLCTREEASERDRVDKG